MRIWSDSFADGGRIPAAYAFAAVDTVKRVQWSGNRNPHLAWDDVPHGTESLLLLCIDGDAPQVADDVNRADRTLAPGMPRGDFFHWVLIDIPPSVRSIAEGAASAGVTPHGKPAAPLAAIAFDGAEHALRQGLNDYTGWFAADPAMAGDYYGYDGPCPPWNDLHIHHYVFRLYALDEPHLALQGRFTGADALAALHGHILDEAQLIGSYTLNPALAPAKN